MKVILMVMGGSRAYGINSENSDIDLRGVHVDNAYSYLALEPLVESIDNKLGGWFSDPKMWLNHSHLLSIPKEGVSYDIIKFLKLAISGNPNILDVLFADESDVIFATPNGKKILENRQIFLSSKACFSAFRGYAEFELRKTFKLLEAAGNGTAPAALATGANAPQMHANYLQASKHAAHTVRILESFRELISTGVYRTKRPNASVLKDIRNGNWTIPFMNDFIKSILEEVQELKLKSPLPAEVNISKVNELCVEILTSELELAKKY